jgi:4-diphosphocytidyl-2-C-methyl-D-erythritol kinase
MPIRQRKPATVAERRPLPVPLVENAPAKVNLTLRLLGRRADGYHEILSLVAFADVGDRLSFAPGGKLTLTVRGPSAAVAGGGADNLVLKAARALAARISSIVLGAFDLEKNLPVAAGIGGGSADAAAALRLLARANGVAPDDPRLYEAARATGADVPVCLDPHPRLMHGIGEKLSAPLVLPPLHAVLVNPGVSLATKDVFAGWTPARAVPPFDLTAPAKNYEEFLQSLAGQANDLEDAAIKLAPPIADVLAALRSLAGCRLARMSGSGATCFGLFSSADEAASAAKMLRGKNPAWWVNDTRLG